MKNLSQYSHPLTIRQKNKFDQAVDIQDETSPNLKTAFCTTSFSLPLPSRTLNVPHSTRCLCHFSLCDLQTYTRPQTKTMFIDAQPLATTGWLLQTHDGREKKPSLCSRRHCLPLLLSTVLLCLSSLLF
jgi:hypothetical protein